MQLHDVRKTSLGHKKKVRVGRGPGSGIGKTSGRGLKGATARSGWAMKASYEGGQMPMFRRLPKRGFQNGPFMVTYAGINVCELGAFPAGSKVGREQLVEAGLVRGKGVPVKILGDGELTVALTVSAEAFTKNAIEKIQKAGGKIEWVNGAPKKPAPDFKKIEAEKKKAKESAKPAEGKDKAAAAAAKPKAEKSGKAPEAGKSATPEAPKA